MLEIAIARNSIENTKLDAGSTSYMSNLQYGDRIQAIAGTFKGLIGHVLEIRDDSTVIFQSVDPGQSDEKDMPKKPSRFQVCLSEVQKKFELGDHVQVLQGEFGDEEGYIVEINGENATVYKRHLVLTEKYGTREDFGTEVSVEFA